jgi:N-acetyl-1-D-myo-inositol-2-amino-2-deoxy-alpha-D-glucopyranoside deacetylase
MSASSGPSAPDIAGRTILAVFAHPDDESLACGGTLARLADAGARVVLICASRGEKGRVSDPALVATHDLASVRSEELREAAHVLGISEVLLLDHPDGDLRWADVPAFHVEIVLAIQRYTPDTVITFGEDGLYWHLDHIGVHERTYTAVRSFGPYAPPLYYVTMKQGVMTDLVRTAIANGLTLRTHPFDIDPDTFGEHAKPPTLLVDVHDWVPRKLAALRCHQTQIGQDSPFRHVSDDQARRLLGVEQFRRSPLEAGWDSVIEQFGQQVAR